MPLINTSVTNLIQGVSQQPDAVRFSGQCEEQENALASVVDGLQKRPATQHIATLIADAEIDSNAKVHFIERDNNERYVVIIKGDVLKTMTAYNLDDGDKATINQKYRGVVKSSSVAGDVCTVEFTQKIPLANSPVDADYNQADGHRVRVVAGGGIAATEYILTSVDQTTQTITFKPDDEAPFDSSFALFGDATGEMQSVIEYTFKGADASDLVLSTTNYLTTGAISGALAAATTPKDDFKLLTTGDVTYILNTEKTVTKDTTISRPVSDEALVFIKQGDYEKKYGVRVKVDGITDPYENYVYSGSSQAAHSAAVFYNTAVNAQTDTILAKLFSSTATPVADPSEEPIGTDRPLNFETAGLHTHGGFYSTLLSPQLGEIKGPVSPNYTIYPFDGLAGAGIGIAHKAVTSITDLPEVAPHRYKVKVIGDIEEATDDRYVQFLVAGSDKTTADGTIGQGSWSEIAGDEVLNRIDPNTMPLMLRNTAENVFELAHMPLDELLAGDENTNPDPSFVGSTISGVFQFKGRLGFLSGASVSMTEVKFGSYEGTNGIQHYNFYRTSVVSLLDSSPIDVTLSSAHVVNLRNAMGFQDNLVMFSDFGQFVLRGGDILTPKTVSANPITEFEYDSSVSPVALGAYIYFPFTRGGFTGVREFTVNSNTDVFDANEITSHVPQYVPTGIVSMTGSSSEELLALTDGTDIYIYKYFFSGDEKVLSSWSKFTISGGGIRGIGFVDSDLYIVQCPSGASAPQTHLLKLPLENKQRDAEGYNTHLDKGVDVTFNADAASPTFNVPYMLASGETLQAYTKDGLLLQNIKFASKTDPGITTVTFKDNIVSGGVTGAEVELYVGIPYTMKYTFSEQLFKAASGDKMSPTNSGRMLIRNGSLFFTDTSHFVVKVTPHLRNTSESEFNATVVQATTEGSMPLESNSFRFPVFTDPKGTVITIENASAAPCNLQSAEFESFVHQRSRRYG